MIADNLKESPRTLEEVGLTLTSQIQADKLIVQGLMPKNGTEYIGELVNTNVDFEDFQELIGEKKVKVFPIADNLIKIKVGPIPIELISKPKIEDENHTETEKIQKLLMTQSLMKQQIKQYNEELQQHKTLITDLQMNFNHLNEKIQATENKVTQQGSTLNQHETKIQATENKVAQQDEKLKMHESKIQATLKSVAQQDEKLNLHENKIKETSNIIVQHSEELTQHETKLNNLKNYIEGDFECHIRNFIRFELSFATSKLNEPISSCKWSEELKSKLIKIDKNVVTLKRSVAEGVFCLLNASFSNTLKSKQSWTIRYNKKAGWISLGVCLKSKMIEYNFNDINMNWLQTGNGLYMIGEDGRCFSHLYKEFNSVWKSFQFGVGDVIDIEYDPIECKLRFILNKGDDDCEIPIIAPPENDAYHPCVCLGGLNSEVELIEP